MLLLGVAPGALSATRSTAVASGRPAVEVSPSLGLDDHDRVTVRFAGFVGGVKVFLSECATTADISAEGCGPQLAQQPFLVTTPNGTGVARFGVRSPAATRSYDTRNVERCLNSCVIVAVADTTARAWADTKIRFPHADAAEVSERRLLKIALAAAKRAGDPRPTLIQYAEGTRAKANLVASGDIVPGDEACYLIAMRGHFLENVPTPPGSAGTAGGTVMSLVVNAATGDLLDFGVRNRYPRLARLGRVITAAR